MADSETTLNTGTLKANWPMVRAWADVAALPLLLVLALAMRLYGIDWDGGFLFHPDERAILMNANDLAWPSITNLGVLFNADESPLNPRWFPYGSFPLYVLKFVDTLISPFNDLDLVGLSRAGRILSALADVATIYVVYLLARKLFDRRVGLLAATFTTLAVIHIQLSHFFAVDTFQAFFIVTSVYFMVRLAQEGQLRYSLLAGGFVALAFATKASSMPLLLPLVLVHVFSALRQAPIASITSPMRVPTEWWVAGRRLVYAVAAVGVVFFIAEPYAILDFGRFWADVTEQSEMVRRIRDYPYTRQYVDTPAYIYQIKQLALFGLGLPLGLVAWAGLGYGVYAAVVRRSAALVVVAAFVVPFFLITGSFDVKFLRYLLPITPFLLIYGSGMLIAGLDWVRARRKNLAPWAMTSIVGIVAVTAFYAFSYLTIYASPHTAVRASAWLNANATEGTLILKEHWEEGLPDLWTFERRELPMYNPDGPQKLQTVATELAEAEYLTFYSSRLFGTIPRLPVDYPIPYAMTRAFYPLLFSGDLGYELVRVEEQYPSLLGVTFVNDVFGRPGLTPPQALQDGGPGGVSIGMEFADESFSVYDHPQVLIFQNTGRLSAGRLLTLLGMAKEPMLGHNLMLAPEDEREAQQAGGTISDITPRNGLGARFPLPIWLLAMYAGTLVTLPLGLMVFRSLPDRGYLLARPLGLLLLAYIPWLLASLQWIGFGRGSITLGFLLLTAVSGWLTHRFREELWDFVRQRWRLLLGQEALFLGAFLIFTLIRAANPDLWHPFRGGEKPMDFAYLNAVVRSTYMPPFDPWFAGGSLNYYYFGQFMMATVIKATSIPTAIAYNLAVPLVFSLVVGAAFSLGYNIAEGVRRGLLGASQAVRNIPAWSPVIAGVAAVLFMVVFSNLDGGVQVLQGAAGNFDFWSPTRMMPPDPPGHEITEFPFFTFLFADLHAHMLAMPLGLLALGLSLNTVLLSRRGVKAIGFFVSLGLLALTIGGLWATNAWDFPTYLGVGAVSLALGQYLRERRLDLSTLYRVAGLVATFGVLAVLFWLPYHLRLENAFQGFGLTPVRTNLWHYLVIHGLFIFLVLTMLITELPRAPMRWFRAASESRRWLVVAVAGAAFALAVSAALLGYSTIVALGGMLVVALTLFIRRTAPWPWSRREGLQSTVGDGAPFHLLPLGLLATALAIGIAVDVVVMKGDIERMNTVFKSYLQAWIFLSLAGSYALWYLGFVKGYFTRIRVAKGLWLTGLALLVASSAVYSVLGTRVRLADRFDTSTFTLDGTKFAETASYTDDKGTVTFKWDMDAIHWMQENVEGSPVIVEGRTPLYRWGGRVSIYTGLPTVLGWDWHQRQQRCGASPCTALDARIRDVHLIYASPDAAEALRLLREYDVTYLYVGELERNYYSISGLTKFQDMEAQGKLSVVYKNQEVTVYQVQG
jgi:YYY domain-containing protein